LPNQAEYVVMKPPRRRLTVRALVVVAALFALDFGGVAWVVRHEPHGGVRAQVDPLLIATVFFFVFVPYGLLSALIYLYVPPRWDEVFAVILILIFLVLLIVPSLQHS
jgi:fatty acid desaturase